MDGSQRRDLVSSRSALEDAGEQFFCMNCGAGPLPTAREGNDSDLCNACDDLFEAEALAELAAMEGR